MRQRGLHVVWGVADDDHRVGRVVDAVLRGGACHGMAYQVRPVCRVRTVAADLEVQVAVEVERRQLVQRHLDQVAGDERLHDSLSRRERRQGGGRPGQCSPAFGQQVPVRGRDRDQLRPHASHRLVVVGDPVRAEHSRGDGAFGAPGEPRHLAHGPAGHRRERAGVPLDADSAEVDEGQVDVPEHQPVRASHRFDVTRRGPVLPAEELHRAEREDGAEFAPWGRLPSANTAASLVRSAN